MPATAEVTGPSYISSHSADIILSDVRLIKLKPEGLRSINVLLDEFLFNILNTSRSLSTDKLRQSLLAVLPTSIGKEALLEAEVELRAYWDRIPRPVVLEDDTQTFNLQWGFELLRLKCEAHSTLNETDEDSSAVTRLQEKMMQLGETTPPVPALVPPAALYLTAILESICRHILSNVERVAVRDSSRTKATVQDVFVALCEDHSIYALFKSMRVYQRIEQLAQTPEPRRNESFSRSDRSSISQNSASSNQDLSSSGRDSSSQHRSRGPTDTATTATTTMSATASTSRTSFDKARKQLRSSDRNSSDGDSQSGYKKSDSLIGGDETKHPSVSYEAPPEDTAMLKEFDNLIRSDSTMKMSLTPDRLKTMEVYKSEKECAGRRPPALALGKGDQPDTQPTPPSRAKGKRPYLSTNITSPSNLPSSSTTSVSSTSDSSVPRVAPRKSSRSNLPPSSQTPPMPSATPRRSPSRPASFDPNSGFPAKTRRIQKNIEDMDIDDIMAGSDDDGEPAPAPASAPRTPSKAPPVTPNKRTASSPAVSAWARELMDFLAEGPPDVPRLSAAGRDMVDFLAQGSPDQGGPLNVGEQKGKKGSWGPQHMMSKLSMGASERSRSQSSEDFGRGNGNNKSMPPTTPVRTTAPGLPHLTSYGNLANRPVPPRMPLGPPISPPSSPSGIEPMDNSRLPGQIRFLPPIPSTGRILQQTSVSPGFPMHGTDPHIRVISASDRSSSNGEDSSFEDRPSKSGSSSRDSRSVTPSTTPEPVVATTSATATKIPLLPPRLPPQWPHSQERTAEQTADAHAMSGCGSVTERVRLEAERLAEEQRVQVKKAPVAAEAVQVLKAEEERIAAEEAERARLEAERLAEERLRLEEEQSAEERRVQVENERIAEEQRVAAVAADRARIAAEEAEHARLEAERVAGEEAAALLAKQKAADNTPSTTESDMTVSPESPEGPASCQTEAYIDNLLASWERRRPLLSMITVPDADRRGLSADQVRQRLGDVEAQISVLVIHIIGSREARRAAQRLESDRAQSFVDAIQEALDWGALADSSLRSKARHLMQKVSEAGEQLPSSLFIEGVNNHDEHPTFGGGFGDVYQASYQGKMVALKRIRTFTADSTTHRNRLQFYKEALVWQGLRHRFVLPLLGIDRLTFAPSFCMVSPWMKHGTVLKYLRDRGRGDVNRLLLEIAQGLDYLHSMNVVHGDLRGNNILVTDDGSACLSDFGLATTIADADSTIGVTSSSNRAGSVRWFAPELIDPAKFGCKKFTRTKASDVYAYACVCLELYTGNPPFSHLQDVAAMLWVIGGQRPEQPPSISPAVWQLMTSAWVEDFRARSTIYDIAVALEGIP